MKVLIIHHLEPMWIDGFTMFGTTYYEQLENVANHLVENTYDHVVLTRFEECTVPEEFYDYMIKVDTVEPYAYGWEYQEFIDCPERFCEGGSHSEAVFITEWMEDLKGNSVDICGAFDGQCIEDLEIALDHLDIDYNRLNHLIT